MKKVTLAFVLYILIVEICYVHDGLQGERARKYATFYQCVGSRYHEIPYRPYSLYRKCHP